MTNKRIRLIYGTVSGAAIGIAGLLMIAAAFRIYRGDFAVDGQLYSPAAVAAAFQPIAVAVYIALALVIGGLILNMIFPSEKKKLPAEKQYRTILENLQKKYAPEACESSLRQQIEAQQKKRKTFKILSFAILGISGIVFLCYGLNSSHFPLSDATGSMIKAMWFFIPCLLVPFGFAVFSHYVQKRSITAEITLLKQAISQGAISAAPAAEPAKKVAGISLKTVQCVILCLALIMMVYGIIFGGTKDVLTKAINLCTECVGLG